MSQSQIAAIAAERDKLREENKLLKSRGDIYIIFDGPPGPVSPRFIEVENESGKSINAGEWIERPDGLWALMIPESASKRLTDEVIDDLVNRAYAKTTIANFVSFQSAMTSTLKEWRDSFVEH